jgi:hypothetical protein
VGGILFSGLAGILGGLLLTCMIVGVEDAPGLLIDGWLTLAAYYDRPYYDAFVNTSAGFLFPIYGLFLGLGVGWSMLALHHDPEIKDLMSDGKKTEKTVSMFRDWTRVAIRKAFWKSGPYAIGMALAGIAAFFLFHAKYMDCIPKQTPFPTRCDVYRKGMVSAEMADLTYREKGVTGPVASLEWRAAGTSLIIYAGALSLTVAYLLALLTIRFGVEVPEDKNFAPIKETSVLQPGPSFAEDRQSAPAPHQTVPV